MAKTKVIVQELKFDNNDLSLLPIKIPAIMLETVKTTVFDAVKNIFEQFGGGKSMLKPSGDVYIKPNGIDSKPYCYTRPVVLEAVVKYFTECGARQVYVFENSTQSNYTRIVFDVIGYTKICKKYGAKPIYLDEERTEIFDFKANSTIKGTDSGYDHPSFAMSYTVVEKLIRNKDQNLYIDLPKLKTHSMGGVTLGIKNQWGFPKHADRKYDHNFNLHHKLIDVLEHISPDFTLIDGVEGTIHGHYPPTALVEKLVKPFRILIGGSDVLATDLVGARIFGLTPEDVPHLKIAIDRHIGVGVKSLSDIAIVGDLSRFSEKYSTDLYDAFPPDVTLITGKERWCKEGCRNNPLTLMQILYLDYGGAGKFNFVAGKGHDLTVIDKLEAPVFIAGHCAIEEVGDRLISRLGKKNVYLSDGCNNLAQSAAALLRLMQVSAFDMVPMNPLRSAYLLFLAKLHKSQANVPNIFSKWKKTV